MQYVVSANCPDPRGPSLTVANPKPWFGLEVALALLPRCEMGRKRKPVELPATAKAKVGPHALGRGSHASACVKVMISNVYTGLMHFLLKKVGVLEHGPKWGEVIADVGSHPLRTLVAKLMHVSTDTVRRAVCKVKGASWWDNHTSHNRQLDPKKRGPNEKTVEEKRADWCFIYDVLCDKITQCRRDGDTMTIHQVAVVRDPVDAWMGGGGCLPTPTPLCPAWPRSWLLAMHTSAASNHRAAINSGEGTRA